MNAHLLYLLCCLFREDAVTGTALSTFQLDVSALQCWHRHGWVSSLYYTQLPIIMYFSVTIPYCLLSLLKLSNPLCKLVFPPTKCPAISVCKTELHKKVYIVLVQNRLNFGLVLIDWEGLKATWNIICILVILH